MYFERDDTIVALATAHGTAAIAVIRLSGPEAYSITESIFRNKIGKAKRLHTIPRIPYILGQLEKVKLHWMNVWFQYSKGQILLQGKTWLRFPVMVVFLYNNN